MEESTPSDFASAMEALNSLEDSIISTQGTSGLKEIHNEIKNFKKHINTISMDMNQPMEDKLDFYFDIIHPFMSLLNKFQNTYSNSTRNKYFIRNFIDLRIIGQFVIYSIVSNSYNLYLYNTQISANLLARILETQAFNHHDIQRTDLPDPDSPEYLDDFYRMFNFHQTTAGLYTAALYYLDKIHLENAKEWAGSAFYHFYQLQDLFESSNLSQLVDLVQTDENQDILELLIIMSWSSLDFIHLMKTVHAYFGSDWQESLEITDDTVPSMVESEYLDELLTYFENLLDRISQLDEIDKDDFRWHTIDTILEIIRHNSMITKKFELDSAEITKETIDIHLSFILRLVTFSTKPHHDTIIHFYIMDAIENLLLSLVTGDFEDSNYVYDIIESVPNFHHKIGPTRDHGVFLLYYIVKYNHIRNHRDETDIIQLISEMNNTIDKIYHDTLDSLMLRIIHVLIEYCHGGRQEEKTISRLEYIKSNVLTDISVHRTHFIDYIDYLSDSIRREAAVPPTPGIAAYFYDWRSWLLPELPIDLEYIPLNSQSLVITEREDTS